MHHGRQGEEGAAFQGENVSSCLFKARLGCYLIQPVSADVGWREVSSAFPLCSEHPVSEERAARLVLMWSGEE